MNRKQFLYNAPVVTREKQDDDDEPEKEDKRDDLKMLNKRLEKYFFEKRSVYLWGVVDDKSAKEVVSKFLLLEADKPGEEISGRLPACQGSPCPTRT